MSQSSQHILDHESFPLSDPSAAWQIQSGSIALCRTSQGQRECFFTVNPGEILLGVGNGADVVALALEPTVVIPL